MRRSIADYVNKPFFLGVDKLCVRENEQPGLDLYWLELLYPNNRYMANVSKVDAKGVHWYTFVLGVFVKGCISFEDIDKHLVPTKV